MMTKSLGRVFLVLATVVVLVPVAFADEIVHFTNGAEMTVRSHSLENDQQMVRVDLGGNSFIAFPMAMVDKIVSAGQDVYVNPVFHPANQAVAGTAVASGGPVADTAVRGGPQGVGFVRQPVKGREGVMLGEAADAIPTDSKGGPIIENAVAYTRRRFNPTAPTVPGGQPQVIMPSNPMQRPPIPMAVVPGRASDPTPPPPTPPANNGNAENPPSDPAPEDPPDNP